MITRAITTLAIAAVLLVPTAARAAEGDLDPSFGTGGTVTTPIPPGALANAVTVDQQGRIVAAGWSGSYPNFAIAVARYTPSGALDTTFNGTGTVTTPIGTFAQANAVAVDSQNRVVVAGYDGNNFVVVRYTPSGALDGSFGTGGIATAPVGPSESTRSRSIPRGGSSRPATRSMGRTMGSQ